MDKKTHTHTADGQKDRYTNIQSERKDTQTHGDRQKDTQTETKTHRQTKENT